MRLKYGSGLTTMLLLIAIVIITQKGISLTLLAGQVTSSGTGSRVDSRIISPGESFGPLKLGDTREKLLELFPFKKNTDGEYDYSFCGGYSEIHSLNLDSGARHASDISFFLKKPIGLSNRI